MVAQDVSDYRLAKDKLLGWLKKEFPSVEEADFKLKVSMALDFRAPQNANGAASMPMGNSNFTFQGS